MNDLLDLLIRHEAALVLVVTFAARVGLPIPAAPLLVMAGGLAVGGFVSLPLVFASSVLANVLGDWVWFQAGRRFGYRVMAQVCRFSLSPDSCVRQSESLIARWGGSSLVAAKFVPGVSVVAAPMAGALGMPLLRFVWFDALAGAVWTGVFVGLGVLFSEQIERLLATLSNAGTMAAVVLALVLAVFAGQRYWRRRHFMRMVSAARIDADELETLMANGEAPVIIDVRSQAAALLDPRQLPGALRVDLGELRLQAGQLPHDRDIVTYCNCPNEASAARAACILASLGFQRARPLAGGLEGWALDGRPIELNAEAREAGSGAAAAGRA